MNAPTRIDRTPLLVIDADTHLSEPHDLWTRNAPAAYRDRVPQVKMLDGEPSWVIDGDKSIGRGASPSCAVRIDGVKPAGLNFLEWSIDDTHLGAHNTAARVKLMDELGIHAQIVYPNLLGFGGQKAVGVDPDLRLICTQLYNDAMAEMQAESGNRILPMALLPWWDVNLSVQEAQRCADMGLKGININSDPHTQIDLQGNPLPDLGKPAWDPLWELCEDLKLPVNFHIGGSEQSMDWYGQQAWPGLERELHAALGGAMLFFNNGRVLANLIFSGLLDRFPKLSFVSVESGIGWIPVLLESLDYQYREFRTPGSRGLELSPAEYFKRNFYACFWFESDHIAHSIEAVGVDNCLFETDFPHPTCLYPSPVERATENLAALDDVSFRKVMGQNAARLYQIDV